MPGRAWILVLCALALGCVRNQVRTPDQPIMTPLSSMPALIDDLEFSTLVKGLEANIENFRTKVIDRGVMQFGPTTITQGEYLAGLEFLLSEAQRDETGGSFRQALRENFQAYEVTGNDQKGDVFITSYYEPVIRGSHKRTAKYSQPLYAVPRELADYRRMRTIASDTGEPGQIAPRVPKMTFWDRRAIDGDRVLKGRGLELAWVDPIDAFTLQIQGSGVVQFNDRSELRVGYADQNGHGYVPIGKFLLDFIPLEKMSLQTIEAHLRSLPPEEMREILYMNPSYVFFRPLETRGITSFGTEVVEGRTVATDRRFFPKGTLAFLQFEKPAFESEKQDEPSEWIPTSRFVLDQDTGGAIRGPERLDLFWGKGASAKQAAGVMKNTGRLFYFVPRPAFLAKQADLLKPRVRTALLAEVPFTVSSGTEPRNCTLGKN